jgi:hypothetical protein
LFAGFSGLLLSVFIIIGRYAESLLPEYCYIAHCLLSSLWFILNIFLTAWFLNSTFEIVQDDSRDKLIIRYSINESFIEDIRKRLSELIPLGAFTQGILPYKKDYGLDISTFGMGGNDGEEIKVKFKKGRYVKSIRFSFLKIVIALIKDGDYKKSRLVFPVYVDNHRRNEFILAKCKGIHLSYIQKLFLSAAYKFSKNKPFEDETLQQIILAIVGNVYDEMEAVETKRFELAIDNLAKWHSVVFDALSFVNDNDKEDNWMLLPSSAFWGGSYLDQLLREYFLIIKKCVHKIPETEEFYDAMLGFHKKLYVSSRAKSSIEIKRRLIEGEYYCWVALVDWHRARHSSDNGKATSNYEGAIISYVGAWESWLLYLEPKSARWKDATDHVPLFVSHLHLTAQQVVLSVKTGDFISSKWAADMLMHWLSNASTRQFVDGKYLWRHEVIVHCYLDRNSQDGGWDFILNGNEYDEASAAQIALENAWLDISLVVSAYIISLPGMRIENQLIANSILNRDRFFPSGDSDFNCEKFNSASDILSSYLRATISSEYQDGSYCSWLSGVIDQFSRMDEPKVVSGRVYSSCGSNDVYSLRKFYVVFAVQRSSNLWGINHRWIEILASDFYGHVRRERLIEDLRKWNDIADDQDILDEFDVTAENVSIFKESISGVIDSILKRNVEEVRSASIDSGKLLEFGSGASITGFSKDTGGVVLKHFKNVSFSANDKDLKDYSLKISEYDKSNVSAGIETNRAINELDWLDKSVANSVSVGVFRSLVSLRHTAEYRFDSDILLINQIVSDINTVGDCGRFILFVGSWGVNKVLSEKLTHSGDSDGFNVKWVDGFPAAYICHLNGVEVYYVPVRGSDICILVNADKLDKVIFRDYGDKRYVNAVFEDLNEDTLKGSLRLTYGMRIEYDNSLVSFKYTLKG